MKFGRFLKKKRIERQFTLDEFAELCGVSAVYLYDIEVGETDTYAEGLFYKMASILGMDGDDFIIESGRIPKWAYKYILKNWQSIKPSLKN